MVSPLPPPHSLDERDISDGHKFYTSLTDEAAEQQVHLWSISNVFLRHCDVAINLL